VTSARSMSSQPTSQPQKRNGFRMMQRARAKLRRSPTIIDIAARVMCAVGVDSVALRRANRRLAIVMFHGIEPEPLSPACSHVLAVSMLRKQLTYLSENFRVLPLAEALERLGAGTLPDRAVALTFDDGTRNLASHAAPVLRSLNLPAAIFLATGPMGSDETLWPDRLWLAFARTDVSEVDLTDVGLGRMPLRNDAQRGKAYGVVVERLKNIPDSQRMAFMEWLLGALDVRDDRDSGPFRLLTWEEAHALVEDGHVALYPHTVTHPILARCADDKVKREVEDSCSAIEQELGHAPLVFAYPNGRPEDFDDRAVAALRQRGVRWALSTCQGLADSQSDPYALPRIGSTASFALFRLQVSGALK
jgi:peptidoglycan/xylan/chitin deacetylase (PgdA/CDA1 family)